MATELDMVEVEPRDGWKLWVRFEDGVAGEVDVGDLRDAPMFAALRDRRVFESVYVHPELKMVCWGEDLEIASCGMYDDLTSARP